MRRCVLNDCAGLTRLAPCCADCDEREQCPDVCPYAGKECASMIEVEDDSEGILTQIQMGKA